jgi:energy-coupling factor transport system ATP-binding protein
MKSPWLFSVDQITYTHPSAEEGRPPALRDISFQVRQGEYIAIVGANGSGKTTLARQLNALLLPQQGLVYVDGKDTLAHENHLFIHQNVGMVFQHPHEQMVATTIEEDVAFGLENLGLPTVDIRERVKIALQQVNMWEQRTRSPRHLSEGQMQRVALAGVIAMQPRCIIFDEATAMLDPRGREDILTLMRSLHRQGITIITITHFMEEAAHADRILALSQGELHFDGMPQALFTDKQLRESLSLTPPAPLSLAESLEPWLPSLASPLTLAQFSAQVTPLVSPVSLLPLATSAIPSVSKSLVQGQGLSYTYLAGTPLAQPALNAVNLTIDARSIHGLIGPTGSGKSTLMQHLNGLYLPQSGELSVGPFSVNEQVDVKALRRYAGYVFQNPNYQLFEQYAGDEIAYALRLLKVPREELRQRVKDVMQFVGLDFELFKDRLTFTLSGGERRKVALASTLVIDPTLLLLDEPTAGLDPAARSDILIRLRSLHTQGKTLLVSSHHLDDLAALTSRITLLNQGSLVTQSDSHVLLSDQPLLANHQMIPPVAVQLADILRAKNWPLPAGVITEQEIVTCFRLGADIR